MTTNLTAQQTGCSFVKEVRDIALWADVDQTTVDPLEEIWRTCGVLIFRRQALSEGELIAFAAPYTTPYGMTRKPHGNPI